VDFPLLPIAAESPLAGAIDAARLDGRRVWRVVCDELLAFFGKYLAGAESPRRAAAASDAPEVEAGAPAELFAPDRASP
jgi:hypothetical protein